MMAPGPARPAQPELPGPAGPVVVCDNGPDILLSSRRPQDLPAFCHAIERIFGHAS